MNESAPLDPMGRDGQDHSNDESAVVPSVQVLASVAIAAVPEAPPDDLLAYTLKTDDDWLLTDDAVAFGDTGVIQRFAVWRASWEQTWTLGPVNNISRLRDLARRLQPSAEGCLSALEVVIAQHLQPIANGGLAVLLPVEALDTFRSELNRLADAVRERDAGGFGVVDATPGSDREGLVRAWPSYGDDEVVAASGDLQVEFRPSSGLHVRLSHSDASPTSFGPIESVAADSKAWTITSGDQQISIDTELARPLAWIAPAATVWRVRPIPEIVAWANTIVGLDECLEVAIELSQPVWLTTESLIAGGGEI